ncbi:MAG: hypothetical protein HY319_25885 [Armatimonadetes bacterium]|nr:hypothetical protein [Armatimonadota bacterium]
MNMNTIYASFSDVHMAERAAGALLDHGLANEDLSLIRKEPNADDSEKHEAHAKKGVTTTTGGDAGKGAAKGGGVGAVLGALGALAALTIPGFGLVLGGGALATAIAAALGTAAGGAVAGAAYGYMKDQGVPEDVARKYEDTVKHGGAVLAINLSDDSTIERPEIESILSKYNAENTNAYGLPAGDFADRGYRTRMLDERRKAGNYRTYEEIQKTKVIR